MSIQPSEKLLDVRGVTLQYRTSERIVTATHRVSFSVYPSDRFVLLGPSGCGKSSLLKAVAGYLDPIEGEFHLRGRRINEPGPDRMMVFQEFDQLLPWKTVRRERPVPAAGDPAAPAGGGAGPRGRLHRQGRARPVRRRLPAHALGRHEAAGRDRARDGDGAGDPADGRAIRRARRADPADHAGRAAAPLGRHAFHRPVRHALDQRGDQDRQPHPAALAASRPGPRRDGQPAAREARTAAALLGLERRIHDLLFARAA